MSLFSTLKSSRPFFLIAGLNVLESYSSTYTVAYTLKQVCKELGLKLVFKASFDKANRSNQGAYRGPGLVEGMKQLKEIKSNLNIPIVTDIHEKEQCGYVKECGIDMIQIPSFLCRQTDLIYSAADTGLPILLKKGQFASPNVMHAAKEKILSRSCTGGVILCERGTSMGAEQLIVDFRNLILLRSPDSLVVLDCTHAAQRPAARTAEGKGSGGDLFAVKAYARAGVAVGVDGLFIEVHEDPQKAPVDSLVQLPLGIVDTFLKELIQIAIASKWRDDERRLNC